METQDRDPVPDDAALRAAIKAALADHKPEWLTVDELAERLRQPRQNIYLWRMKGYGPRGIKVGTRVLYRRTEVERWEAEQMRAQHGDRGAALAPI